MRACVCVRACVSECLRASVCVCVCVCVCVEKGSAEEMGDESQILLTGSGEGSS